LPPDGASTSLPVYQSNAPCLSASHSIQSIHERPYSIQLYRLYTIQRYTLPLCVEEDDEAAAAPSTSAGAGPSNSAAAAGTSNAAVQEI
jgi:hypothetical protein